MPATVFTFLFPCGTACPTIIFGFSSVPHPSLSLSLSPRNVEYVRYGESPALHSGIYGVYSPSHVRATRGHLSLLNVARSFINLLDSSSTVQRRHLYITINIIATAIRTPRFKTLIRITPTTMPIYHIGKFLSFLLVFLKSHQTLFIAFNYQRKINTYPISSHPTVIHISNQRFLPWPSSNFFFIHSQFYSNSNPVLHPHKLLNSSRPRSPWSGKSLVWSRWNPTLLTLPPHTVDRGSTWVWWPRWKRPTTSKFMPIILPIWRKFWPLGDPLTYLTQLTQPYVSVPGNRRPQGPNFRGSDKN